LRNFNADLRTVGKQLFFRISVIFVKNLHKAVHISPNDLFARVTDITYKVQTTITCEVFN